MWPWVAHGLCLSWKVKDESVQKDSPYKVFFRDLFLFKENEMAAKKRQWQSARSPSKTGHGQRSRPRPHQGLLNRSATAISAAVQPASISIFFTGADAKRTVHEFINDQRDRFLLEFALSTKRNTIQKYEKHTTMKERQLMKAEKKLQEDAMAFEEFLRENDQRSVDALKMAAQETINKLQMTAELKKASMEIQAVKSEIAKTEFLLREYMKYGFFLLKLSPKQWQIQQAMKRVSKSKENVNAMLPSIITINIPNSGVPVVAQRKQIRLGTKGLRVRSLASLSGLRIRPESISSEDSLDFLLDDDMDYDLEPELYFKEPEELLQVLTELEEQNLTLVQYSQDVDENLEDVNKRERLIQDKINSSIEFLLEHKEMLKASCLREEEKAAELELRSRLFSFGEFNSDTQEKLIDSLSKKINQVYRVCIGDAEVGSLNPIQKLVKVESRLVELSDLIESIPKENVEAIERMKQKERRQKLREEKMREKQKHQEERLKAALERAVAQPKKKLGRRLIYRSKPPSANKHELFSVKDTKTKSLEEEYFFT
uniref:DUF4200 domain-containing protein n=1 Tax=Sus scrofa TaxID=9823 RepID=A0A8D1F4D2_PIG